jgi:hypothetical protein
MSYSDIPEFNIMHADSYYVTVKLAWGGWCLQMGKLSITGKGTQYVLYTGYTHAR